MNLAYDRVRWCTECAWHNVKIEATHVVNLNDDPRMQRFACIHHAENYSVKQTMVAFWEEYDRTLVIRELSGD